MNIKKIGIKYGVKNTISISFFLVILIFVSSCNESEFLEEEPLDFLSPITAYTTLTQFEASINQLHANYRDDFWGGDNINQAPRILFYGTDLAMNDKDLGENPPDYSALTQPASTRILYMWQRLYSLIQNANVIITRADAPASLLSEEERNIIVAEALFFRALSYKMLANIYGGVPIVLEEVETAKRNYTRANRGEVYAQCALDLEFAVMHLPDISEAQDYRINKEAANHLLSEVYISLGEWDKAITAATSTINNPGTSLMQERFGSRVNDPDFGGDVYWDLFRQGNQNRSSGNKEALWVLQYEFNVSGGANDNSISFAMERITLPRLWQARILDTDGQVRNLLAGGPNTFYYGRGSGFQSPTPYFRNELWTKSGSTDIRNSEFNIVRDFKVNNPDSPSNGNFVVENNLIIQETYIDTDRNFYPVMAKNSTPGLHPRDLFAADQSIPGSLLSSARQTFRDHYSMRLAETYLLRAEAYLGKGDLASAASDINKVRQRSSAPDVAPEEVDIDYILDERLRELYYEEFRLLTLMRLGKVAERTRKYNNEYVGATIQDFHNLWPIPLSEQEANTEANLEQNPGY